MSVPTYVIGASGSADATINSASIGTRSGYVLELREDGDTPTVVETFVFPIPPRTYDVIEPFTSSLTGTEGNGIVAEEYGTIIADLRVEGTFGLSDKKVSGYQSITNGGDGISGNQHFAILRQIFREYSRRKKDPTLGPITTLVWHSLREDDHFIIVPKQFETPRSASGNRIHYEYKIAASIVGSTDDVRAPTLDSQIGFDDALGTIGRAFSDAQSAFADVNSNIAQLQRRAGNVQAIMTQVAGLLTSVGNSLTGLSRLIEYPVRLAANVAEQIAGAADDIVNDLSDATSGQVAQGARDMRRMEAALNRIVAFPDRFASAVSFDFKDPYAGERRLSNRDVTDGTAGARPGSRNRVAFGTEGQAGLNLGTYTGAQAVLVDRSTTLAALAARYGVPPELIIVINDLRAPYFTEGGGPGTLGPGDTVLIPTSTGARGTAAAPVTSGYLSTDELLYGRDLALDSRLFLDEGLFDIRVDGTHGSLDAEVIGGIPNVVQGTRISIETERGTTVYIPDLGIARTVGKKGVANSVSLANLYLREAMLFDPRIDRILQSIVKLAADVLSQDISVLLVGARSAVTFVRPYGRASGGS